MNHAIGQVSAITDESTQHSKGRVPRLWCVHLHLPAGRECQVCVWGRGNATLIPFFEARQNRCGCASAAISKLHFRAPRGRQNRQACPEGFQGGSHCDQPDSLDIWLAWHCSMHISLIISHDSLACLIWPRGGACLLAGAVRVDILQLRSCKQGMHSMTGPKGR